MEYPELERQLGIRIKYIREVRGLSQDQLAELADISVPHMSKIESSTREANPKLKTINKIAEALNVPITKLFKVETDL